MRHAYLIIAHTDWEQLKLLVRCLDSENADIYIHIDARSKNVPLEELKAAAAISDVNIYSEYKTCWGSYGIVEAELFLLRMSHAGHYDYYHLLSGADLPIKPMEEIDGFFMSRAGYEFVHFEAEERLNNDPELRARIRWYHFFQSHRSRFKLRFFNGFFTLLARASFFVQLLARVDRTKKHPETEIKYGSMWVSITDSLAEYLLSSQSLIEELFKYTKCADEFFVQTMVYNSEFKDRLYKRDFEGGVMANMRLIDWERGGGTHPYIWKDSDWDEISRSNCLFARKFSLEIYPGITEKVCGVNGVEIRG